LPHWRPADLRYNFASMHLGQLPLGVGKKLPAEDCGSLTKRGCGDRETGEHEAPPQGAAVTLCFGIWVELPVPLFPAKIEKRL